MLTLIIVLNFFYNYTYASELKYNTINKLSNENFKSDTDKVKDNGITDISRFFAPSVGDISPNVVGNTVKLVSDSSEKYGRGAITSKQKIDFNRSFEFIGRFRIDRESDGVAITFHNDPNGIYAIGGPGGGIGAGQSVIPPNILPGTIHKPPHFEGISNGFMLELDTYMNDFWNMYLYEGFEGLMDKNIPIKKDSKEFHVALIKLNEFNYPDKPTKHNYETILSKELYTNKSNKEDKRVPFKLTWTPNISEKTGVLRLDLGDGSADYPSIFKEMKLSLGEVCNLLTNNGSGENIYRKDNMKAYLTLSTSTSREYRNPKQEFDFIKFQYTNMQPEIQTNVYDSSGKLISGIDDSGKAVNSTVKAGEIIKIENKVRNKTNEIFDNTIFKINSSENLDMNSISNIILKYKDNSNEYVEKSISKEELLNGTKIVLDNDYDYITYDVKVQENLKKGDKVNIQHVLIPELQTSKYISDTSIEINFIDYNFMFLSSDGNSGYEVGINRENNMLISRPIPGTNSSKIMDVNTKISVFDKYGNSKFDISNSKDNKPIAICDHINSMNIKLEDTDIIRIYHEGASDDLSQSKMKLQGEVFVGKSDLSVNSFMTKQQVDNSLFEVGDSKIKAFENIVNIDMTNYMEIERGSVDLDLLKIKVKENIKSIVVNFTDCNILGENDNLNINLDSDINLDEIGSTSTAQVSILAFGKLHKKELNIKIIKPEGIDVSVPMKMNFAIVGNLLSEEKFIAPTYEIINNSSVGGEGVAIDLSIKDFTGEGNYVNVVLPDKINDLDSPDKQISLGIFMNEKHINLITDNFEEIKLGKLEANSKNKVKLYGSYGKDFSKFNKSSKNINTKYNIVWKLKIAN